MQTIIVNSRTYEVVEHIDVGDPEYTTHCIVRGKRGAELEYRENGVRGYWMLFNCKRGRVEASGYLNKQ